MNRQYVVPVLGIALHPSLLLADMLQWFLRGLVASVAFKVIV